MLQKSAWPRRNPKKHLVSEWHAKGYAAGQIMDGHLAKHDWLSGDAYSIADIALYAHTRVADEVGFDLSRHPGLLARLQRVEVRPNYIPLSKSW